MLPSTHSSSKWFLSLRSSYCIHLSCLPYVLHAPPVLIFVIFITRIVFSEQYRSFTSSLYSFYHQNTFQWAVQIIHLLIIQFLSPEYSSMSSTDHPAPHYTVFITRILFNEQYRSFTSSLYSFYHQNTLQWAVQIIQLLIIQFLSPEYSSVSSTDHSAPHYTVFITRILFNEQYRSSISWLYSFYHQNTLQWAVQIIQLLIIQFLSPEYSSMSSTDHSAPHYTVFSTPLLPRPS